jgi:pyrroline-5-carboxylate reductase
MQIGRIGFLGTGTIARAVVTGLIGLSGAAAPFERIALSPRNAEIAARLAGLDARVHVCESNQDVLDSSDVILLAVRPQIAPDVLGELTFDARHHVISLIAGMELDAVRKLVRHARKVVRAVPLPPVAQGKGSTAVCPSDDIARALFAPLGQAIEVDDEHAFSALAAVTATMASFYALLEQQASWLVGEGLSYENARAFLSGYHVGLAHEATIDTRPFSQIIGDSCTRGGLNEQLYKELSERGTFTHYSEALDKIMQRIQGRG